MKKGYSKQQNEDDQFAQTMRLSSQNTEESRSTYKAIAFTNEFINKCMDANENRKTVKSSNDPKQPKQKNLFLCQLLKINSINNNLKAFRFFERNQQQKNKKISNMNQSSSMKNQYIKKASMTAHEYKRPKSAMITVNHSKTNKSAKLIQYSSNSQQVSKTESQVLLKVISLQDKLLNKPKQYNKQISKTCNFFTSNPNVFMPLNKSRAYIGKSQLDSYKKAKTQLQKSKKDVKYIKNQMSFHFQKQLSQKCRQLLKSTTTVSSKLNVVHSTHNHNLIKKKADSSLHYQFLKQNKEGYIFHKNQVNVQSYNNSFSRQASISILHENMIQCNKNIQNQRKSLRKTKLLKSRVKQLQKKKSLLKNKQNIPEPSLYIQSVDVKVEAKHREEHYHSIHTPSSVEVIRICLSHDQEEAQQIFSSKLKKTHIQKDEYYKS